MLQDAIFKYYTMKILFCLTLFLLFTPISYSSEPPIKDFGLFYEVPKHEPISKDTALKLVFDVAEAAEKGNTNFSINSLARFINMHVAHGVPLENIQLALVVHGSATNDLLNSDEYRERFELDNKNQSLITQLLENNTKVYVCGQSATHYNVSKSDLISGVKMSLSAMTAHALLQQQGYALNPF